MPAKASQTSARTKRFSLVPAAQQIQMYKTLTAMKSSGTMAGAEVAEIAVCFAIAEKDPVILAYAARGARTVRKNSTSVTGASKVAGAKGGRLAAATISAVAALLGDFEATALVCAGPLSTRDDYRNAFGFAARHKLPILYVVANTLTPGKAQELDLRTLYAEFGIPVFSVDTNDAIAAFRVATEALHNARHQRGPCVIEALVVDGENCSRTRAIELLRDYMERHGNWPL